MAWLFEPIMVILEHYVWLMHDEASGWTVAVDPGESEPVEAMLQKRGWSLDAIWLTHHHHDHVDGTQALQAQYKCPVYGFVGDVERLPPLTHALRHGDRLPAGPTTAQVIAVPGHTTGHIAFYLDDQDGPILFCGDTLFSCSCGRLFEGTAGQMLQSLQRLAALPDNTRLFCGHEYTLRNIEFALKLEPENAALRQWKQGAEKLRAAGKPTLPTTLAHEKAINPFLRSHTPVIRESLGMEDARDVEVFAEMRKLRNAH